MYVASERNRPGESVKFDFYDSEFNHLPFYNSHPNADKPIAKPEHFEEMKEIARRLSQGFPHIRVDLYHINGEIYFGELTFFHMGGVQPFIPDEWDYTFGEWLKLPEKPYC